MVSQIGRLLTTSIRIPILSPVLASTTTVSCEEVSALTEQAFIVGNLAHFPVLLDLN